MKISVDHAKCVGCGRCTEACPGVFKLEEAGENAGKSHVYGEETPENIECAKSAADQCPVGAIWVDE
jgi:ferredoxin